MNIYIGYGICVYDKSIRYALLRYNIVPKDKIEKHVITKDNLEELLYCWDKRYHQHKIDRKETFVKSVANAFDWIRQICHKIEYYKDRFHKDLYNYIKHDKNGYRNEYFISYNDEVKKILNLTVSNVDTDKWNYKGNPKEDLDNTKWLSTSSYYRIKDFGLYNTPSNNEQDCLAYTHKFRNSDKIYKLGNYLMELAKKYFIDNDTSILLNMADYESLRPGKTKTEEPKDLPFDLSIAYNEKENVYFIVKSSSVYRQICINIEGYDNNIKATLERKVWKEFDTIPEVCMFLGDYEVKLKK